MNKENIAVLFNMNNGNVIKIYNNCVNIDISKDERYILYRSDNDNEGHLTIANLDNVNLLNVLRKNELISGIGKNEDEKTKTDYYDYTLNAPLICKNKARDMANFSMLIKERGKIE